MVFFIKKGEGEPLFLLHSGGMSHEEWQPQIDFLQKYFTLYLVDLPGHGNTPMKGEKLSIAECGEAVLEVLEQEGFKKAHFCGSSMGGATALWMAKHHPDKVKKLVIYRANYYKNEASYQETLKMADPKYWEALGMVTTLSKMHLGQGGKEAWKEVIKRVSDALNPLDSDHGYDLEELAEIAIPVMIVAGDRDPLVPLKDLMNMYQVLPDASLWVLPQATHITATNTWRKGIFAMELQRFLVRKSRQVH